MSNDTTVYAAWEMANHDAATHGESLAALLNEVPCDAACVYFAFVRMSGASLLTGHVPDGWEFDPVSQLDVITRGHLGTLRRRHVLVEAYTDGMAVTPELQFLPHPAVLAPLPEREQGPGASAPLPVLEEV